MNKLIGIKAIKASKLIGDRFSTVIAGPSGTGKSWARGTMAEIGPTLVLATLAREAASYWYVKKNLPIVPLWEQGWYTDDAETGSLPAGIRVDAFSRYLETVEALKEDIEYDVILLDSGTELAEIAWHTAMLPHGVIAPAYMTDSRSRWLPYETLSTSLDQAVKALVSLTTNEGAKRPKYVGISWHVQPPKDDSVEVVGEGANKLTTKKQSADRAAEGKEYEGKVLPMIRGSFRRKLESQVDAFVFTDIQYTKEASAAGIKKTPKYVIQVQPDEDRHAKIPGPMSERVYIPNNFEALQALIRGRQQTGGEGPAPEEASPAAAVPTNRFSRRNK